jgi:hypothetical protein
MSEAWRLVTRAELLAVGVSAWSLRSLVRQGALLAVGRGTYLQGPRLAGDDGWFQALAIATACVPDAVVVGQAAAALHRFDGFDPGAPITLAVGTNRSSRAPAQRLTFLQPPHEVGHLRVLAPEETLLGLGASAPRPGCRAASRVLSPDELVELAVESALREGQVTTASLGDVLAAGRNRRGRQVLAAVLARRGEHLPTGSYLETRCLQVLRSAGLDDFDRQVELSDAEGVIGRVDLCRGNVVIEVVGERWHLGRFDPDHHRYTRLTAASHRLLLFTFNDIEHRPDHVIRTTRAARAAADAA